MATLNFKGKAFVQNHHLLVKYHQLVPRKEKSLTDKVSLHDNLIIHGDNLKALKALLPIYAGKVKCIYIDPPYNTGNENWIYNDNVNSPMMQDWLGKIVDKEDQTRYDKWLCMMIPRLKLLHELLSDDGLILVSIDDNSIHSLCYLLNEVFGLQKHLCTFVWRRRISSSMASSWISTDHEYVVAYSKNPDGVYVMGDERDMSKYNIPDGKGSYYASMPLTVGMTKEMRPNQWYELKNPKTGTGYWPPEGRIWGFFPPTMNKKIEQDRIIWPEDYSERNMTTPRLKTYAEDSKRLRKPISTWICEKGDKNGGRNSDTHYIDSAKNEEGTKVIKELFGDNVFAYSKPVSLLKNMFEQFTKEDDIILDSFAGSGTTAQAVLAVNEKDGASRQFILVECEDYAEKITAERVRRVINGVPTAKDENLKKGLGGSFSYFELGPPIEMEAILSGDNFPSYADLARYVFYTSTGEEFDGSVLDEKKHFIGESRNYLVYLFYKPDIEYLKATALTLDRAKSLGPYKDKRRLVFAPTKYIDQEHLDELRIDFAQLPFEIYQLVK